MIRFVSFSIWLANAMAHIFLIQFVGFETKSVSPHTSQRHTVATKKLIKSSFRAAWILWLQIIIEMER